MTYVIFRNQGVIDPRSITTFGISSKENPGAIGFFGTGLKYAIAILLREGCEVEVYAGERKLCFGTLRDTVRADEFDFVTMNGEPLGFTTELGKTWELWQAFRELYCNTSDERGEVFASTCVPEPCAGETIVVVRGEAFKEIWETRSSIILASEPLEQQAQVHIHPGSSKFVFYRGVRVHELQRPAQFTYNLQHRVALTEDRTLMYVWDAELAIKRAVLASQKADIVRQAVTAPKDVFEHTINFDSLGSPGEVFLAAVSELMREFAPNLNPTAIAAVQQHTLVNLSEFAVPLALSALEQKRIAKATTFCQQLGFAVMDYPVLVVEFLGEGILGRAHEGKIYITQRTLMMGTKMLAGTLIEEFLHLRHQLFDETRTMQNFLMDTIVSLGEQLLGEPL